MFAVVTSVLVPQVEAVELVGKPLGALPEAPIILLPRPLVDARSTKNVPKPSLTRLMVPSSGLSR